MDLRGTMDRIGAWTRQGRQMGWSNFFFRLGYEMANRTGLREWSEPMGPGGFDRWKEREWPSYPGKENLSDWWKAKRPEFFAEGRGESLRRWGADQGASFGKEIVDHAEAAAAGRLKAFGGSELSFGNPIDWHRDPETGERWDPHVHWSRVSLTTGSPRDIKRIWGVGRFPQAFAFGRAAAWSPASRWGREFFSHLRSFEAENPFRAGVHWSNGQELAIRVCAWMFGIHQAIEGFSPSGDDLEPFFRQAYLHGIHLERHLDFSRRTVPNNHVLGEALALFLLGSYFPWFRSAARWKRLGRKVLVEEGLGQFSNDGGYCQSSHNYHRLALHYLLWAWRCGESLGEKLPSTVLAVFERSERYLLSFRNADGRLPNWGPHDGALLNPWNACDASDFRPLLQALGYAIRGKRTFTPGPWDEDLLWFWGERALEAPQREPWKVPSRSFRAAGLHVLRESDEDFAVLRCGRLRRGLGQADQLHVDLWWKGQNVVVDPGSYRYNEQLRYHEWMRGSRGHSTVTVEGRDQIEPLGRFRWSKGIDTELVRADVSGKRPLVEGRHRGYDRPFGIVHVRRLERLEPGHWRVEDRFEGKGSGRRSMRLHWLLGFPAELVHEENPWRLRIRTPRGNFFLEVRMFGPSGKPVSAKASLRAGFDEGGTVAGWVSRCYSEKAPAFSFELETDGGPGTRFRSDFFPEGSSSEASA